MEAFFRKILPPNGVYYVAVSINGKWRHIPCGSIKELAEVATKYDTAGHEVYFACAAYKQPYIKHDTIKHFRVNENVHAAKAFWLDVDVGEQKAYKTQKEALEALITFNKKAKLPSPIVVCSGNGFHIYYALKDPVIPEVWKNVANQLKALTKQLDFKADAVRTADITSVLRPPFTHNRKNKNNILDVKILVDSLLIENSEFYKAVGVTQQKTKKVESSVIDNILAQKNFPPGDAEKIADRCQQLAHCRSVKGDVSEPLWYGMLGVIAYCKDSDYYAHEWSKGHQKYQYSETEAKLKHWKQATSGPATCDYFQQYDTSLCDGCPHKEKIRSPIQLGFVTEEIQLDSEIKPPYPYVRSKTGLLVVTKDGEIPYKFFDYDLYVSDIISSQTEGEQLVITYNKPHVGLIRLVTKATTFTKVDKTWEFCLSNGIYVRKETDAKHMATYIRGYAAELQKFKTSLATYKNLGWKQDGNFVLGQYVISKNGEIKTNETMLQTVPSAQAIRMHGSLATWIKLTEIFDQPGMETLAFTLLCGFAAPLYKFTGHGGVLVNMIGETGIGKSSVQRMVNSIWGEPTALMLSAKDTEASKLARMSYLNNLPVCIDEMGNLNGDALSSLLLKITQGMDTRRLRQDGTEREQREWSTIVIASSNHSFISKLATKKANSEAEMMRLVEYKVFKTDFFKDKEQAIHFNRVVQNNYGFAGLAYIKLLMPMQERFTEELDKIYTEFKNEGFEFEARERFWEAALATALLAGRYAKRFGLIKFDPQKIVYKMAENLLGQREVISEQKYDVVDLISLFVTTNVNKTLFVEFRKGSLPRYIREPRSDELVIRIETGVEADGTITRASMRISLWHFNMFLISMYEDYISFRKEAKKRGFLIEESRESLGKGTIYGTPPIKTILFNLMHPELSVAFNNMQVVPSNTPKVVSLSSMK